MPTKSAKSVKSSQESKFPEPALPRTFELVDGLLTFPRVEAFKQEYGALCRKYQLTFICNSDSDYHDPRIEIEEMSSADPEISKFAGISDNVAEYEAGLLQLNHERDVIYRANRALEKEQKATKLKEAALRKARKAENILLSKGVTLSKGHYRLVRVDEVTDASNET